jgi:hypothetical protein
MGEDYVDKENKKRKDYFHPERMIDLAPWNKHTLKPPTCCHPSVLAAQPSN